MAPPDWFWAEDLLKSVPGVGDATARTLIADLPELGSLDCCSARKLGRRSAWQHIVFIELGGVKH